MQYAYGGDAGLCPRVHSAFNLKELQQFFITVSIQQKQYFGQPCVYQLPGGVWLGLLSTMLLAQSCGSPNVKV